ncbi:hypothetical protein C6497_01950 [Candidatus Poribacteria bacterium]|nr:MAG: hypothetical protein C6497_01950 [Candidatus Poribacteria bacterium]
MCQHIVSRLIYSIFILCFILIFNTPMIVSSDIEVSGTDLKTNRISKKILNDLKPVPSDSNFIGTLYPILNAAGGEWSIPRLNATFGNAFSFSMKKDKDVVWQHANIDWWLLWEMINDIGFEFQEYQMILNGKLPPPTPTEIKKIKEQTWNQVKSSIDQGVPAIAWQPMTVTQLKNGVNAFGWGLLVGYNEDNKTYTVRHQTYKSDYQVPYDKFGYSDPVQWYCVMILTKRKPINRIDLDIQILNNAVKFAEGSRFDLEKAAYRVDTIGFAAYAQWINLIESGEVDIGFTEHSAWMLWEMRENAEKYLREISNYFTDETRQYITEAAAYFDIEIDEVEKLVNLCKKHKQFTPPLRQEAITIIHAALDAEKMAIGKIKEALESINIDSK